VVGVLTLLAAGAVGLFFLLRRRRDRKQEKYLQANNHSVFNSEKLPTDQRLEPVMLDTRRISEGSLADERDYSRKILRVTNPDA